MITLAHSAQMLIRLTGVVQIVLGLMFWTGNALDLVPVHIVSGLVLVLSLWGLAVVAALSGVGIPMVVLAVVWGFLVVSLGMGQDGLVVGQYHWVVQVLHLLVGLAAIGQGETLAGRIKGLQAATR